MRKIGIYYAFWCHEWDVDFVPFISKVKRLGYDQLEINGGTVAKMERAERKKLVDCAAGEGICMSYGIGLPAEYDVSSPDDTIRKRGIDFMTEMIAAVGSMGGGTIGGTVYGSWPKKLPKNETRESYLNRSRESMRVLSKVAEDEHVVLLCEVLNRFEQFILNTCDQAVDFVSSIGSPACRILLDTFHMNIEEDSMTGAIRKAGMYLGGLHIGECNRKPVGYGERIPWDAIKKALDEVSFRGALVQEPFVMPGGQIGQDISVWRDLVRNPDLDDMAARSARFIREHLA